MLQPAYHSQKRRLPKPPAERRSCARRAQRAPTAEVAAKPAALPAPRSRVGNVTDRLASPSTVPKRPDWIIQQLLHCRPRLDEIFPGVLLLEALRDHLPEDVLVELPLPHAEIRPEPLVLIDTVHFQLLDEGSVKVQPRLSPGFSCCRFLPIGFIRLLLPDFALKGHLCILLPDTQILQVDLVFEAVLHRLEALPLHCIPLLFRLLSLLLRRSKRFYHATLILPLLLCGRLTDHLPDGPRDLHHPVFECLDARRALLLALLELPRVPRHHLPLLLGVRDLPLPLQLDGLQDVAVDLLGALVHTVASDRLLLRVLLLLALHLREQLVALALRQRLLALELLLALHERLLAPVQDRLVALLLALVLERLVPLDAVLLEEDRLAVPVLLLRVEGAPVLDLLHLAVELPLVPSLLRALLLNPSPLLVTELRLVVTDDQVPLVRDPLQWLLRYLDGRLERWRSAA